MAIAGQRPETGARIELTRPRRAASEDAAPWTYEGHVHVPDASHPLRVTVAEDGTVEVALDGGTADLAEKVRLIVRTSVRQAKADGDAPPLRIVRWRGEK